MHIALDDAGLASANISHHKNFEQIFFQICRFLCLHIRVTKTNTVHQLEKLENNPIICS